MKSRSLSVFLFVPFALLAQSAPPPKTVFVSVEQLAISGLLPGPPAAGSAAAAAELAEIHRLQESRTSEQITRAQADDAQEDIFIYRRQLGDGFTRENLPLTAKLSDHVHANEGVVVNPAKMFYHRARPYVADKTLNPVCKVKTDPNDFAYPSGHSTSGYLEALTLVMMVPEKREAILARADDYAHNRLVCGMHYASDIAASKLTAYATIGLMMNNRQFEEELAAAKRETRRALHLPE